MRQTQELRGHDQVTDIEGVLELWSKRREGITDTDIERIKNAHKIAETSHAGQKRRSGHAYITHPLQVAAFVAELGLDSASVAAALLHDTVEDCGISISELEVLCDEEVAQLVDGVTKVDKLKFTSIQAAQAASMRKMLVAVAADVRVLLIKLCDRLHNMHTIGALDDAKARRIADETMEIYAPLADRLGLGEMKSMLEDLSFATLEPAKYQEVVALVAQADDERRDQVNRLQQYVVELIEAAGITARVSGRAKHYWSIYEKMVVRGKEFSDIYDLSGLRIICEDVRDCYGILGVMHAGFTPLPGRFKDYIGIPRFNLYQSLHTTVVDSDGAVLELQIRTEEMDHRAEWGVAAHWMYKGHEHEFDAPWLERLLDWHDATDDPGNYLDSVRGDLGVDEVYVFTPKGDVITLPVGATPIDFAYAIHTDVGHSTTGAKVNGRLIALATPLHSGDVVEIISSRKAAPRRDWLGVVTSSKARAKIRAWFARQQREDALDSGREALERALRAAGVAQRRASGTLVEVAEEAKYDNVDAMMVAIGRGHVSARSIAERIKHATAPPAAVPVDTSVSSGQRGTHPQTRVGGRTRRERRRSGVSVHVEGLDDMLVHLAQCCNPEPGDDIIGFITRGRGVSVHRTICINLAHLTQEAERMVDVEWADGRPARHVAAIEVEALDRTRLLGDVANAIAGHRVSILFSESATRGDQIAIQRYELELDGEELLEAILDSVRGVAGVYDVKRVSLRRVRNET